ncbi:Glutamate-1-semialdehyde 2,1-aminomutase [Labeo rohita]|uniref:Glutamate-1-semialdehyde 2,1-aminomutase n=1 Tax=Labeo rohita TaxID=84645 RepID=A0ABQ8LWC2_LABRO|nr:Glutamate-1-semialdehyde 2,1-aminomutase [Labeo rohita]
MLAEFQALKHFLPDLRDRHVLVRTNSTAVVYYINHQGGLRSRPLYKLAHQILVWSQDKLLSLRAVHIPGHLNLGADILPRQGPRPGEWMLHPEVVKQIWRAFCQAQVDLFATRETSQCPLWCSLTHPAPLGLDAMEFWRECAIFSLAVVLEVVGVAPEGAHLIASGLSTEVVGTILQSRAPSSRKLYALKWKPFTSWCGDHQQDSGFLQDRFSTGLAHSTLKVYVAAILAYHAPLGGSSLGRNPLVTRFLHGALRPRPLARCSFVKCGRDAIS